MERDTFTSNIFLMTGVKISRYLVVSTLITIPNLTRLDEMQTVQCMKEDITLYEGFFPP